MAQDIPDRIISILIQTPGLTARELGARLGEDKSLINSALYSRPDLFYRNDESRPRWWLQSLSKASIARPAPAKGDAVASDQGPVLFEWQERALAEWRANDFRGVVEAVTGAGKTHVGLAAAREHLEKGWKVAVLVPRIPLQEQWVAQIRQLIPGARVGRMGDGHDDSLETCDILVAVVNSAAKKSLGLPVGHDGLLIADECHRYSGDHFQGALEDVFEHRLGLTATYGRDDGAHTSVLTPYFGGVVYSYGYVEAVGEGVIAPFRVAVVPVAFSGVERQQYIEDTKAIGKATGALVAAGAPEAPYAAFMKYVNDARRNGPIEIGKLAGRYHTAVTRRRDLLASTRSKFRAVAALSGAIRASNRTIVFTQTIESAEECARILIANGVAAQAMHSGVPPRERSAILIRFAQGDLQCIVAVVILDEGIDVPEADLGVIVTASRQRRQMVQRMGRILRRKQDRRSARFAIICVEGTVEDPAEGAHEAFLEQIVDIAEDRQRFGPDQNAAALTAFLSP